MYCFLVSRPDVLFIGQAVASIQSRPHQDGDSVVVTAMIGPSIAGQTSCGFDLGLTWVPDSQATGHARRCRFRRGGCTRREVVPSFVAPEPETEEQADCDEECSEASAAARWPLPPGGTCRLRVGSNRVPAHGECHLRRRHRTGPVADLDPLGLSTVAEDGASPVVWPEQLICGHTPCSSPVP